ncbi:uncharacterized protein LOC130984923 isoform X2 [Salvia miltiorrhiza]|uniref:uncharacterized protein LOC130984923 isoform X2 n=1 Tax=Salvia miltiorrhiza TaxID=226208 RepID=UPI0025AC6CA8|nr:uncharacterized protein LOC130984923 isoform X2 [Salvia miltiorrhiza]
MAARIPSSSHKLQALATFLRRHGAVSGGSWRSNPFGRRDPPPYKVGGVGLRLLSDSSKLRTTVKWLLGYVVTFLLPFWKNKWDNLLTLEGEAAKVVGEVEVVAEVVEKVATAADKALEEVVNQLPDNSKLKEAAQALEHVSSVAAKDAQLIENLINKASDVKQDIEELESIVEPIVDKIMHGKHTKS